MNCQFGREENLRHRLHPAGWGIEQGSDQADVFRRTPPFPHVVQARPGLAESRPRAGGLLRIAPIGSKQSRGQAGRFAERHSTTSISRPTIVYHVDMSVKKNNEQWRLQNVAAPVGSARLRGGVIRLARCEGAASDSVGPNSVRPSSFYASRSAPPRRPWRRPSSSEEGSF